MNNNTSSYNRLYGTKTWHNLQNAFTHEAENFAKNAIFSDIAKNEGNSAASNKLSEISDSDKRLAELWLSYIDGVGDTIQNIQGIIDAKKILSEDIYPSMADGAEDEGFYELAEKFRLASSAKNSQGREASKEQDKLNGMQVESYNGENVYRCTECGFTVMGDTKPEWCPLCSMGEFEGVKE